MNVLILVIKLVSSSPIWYYLISINTIFFFSYFGFACSSVYPENDGLIDLHICFVPHQIKWRRCRCPYQETYHFFIYFCPTDAANQSPKNVPAYVILFAFVSELNDDTWQNIVTQNEG